MNGINKILPLVGLALLVLAIASITLPAFAAEKVVGKTLLTRGEVVAKRGDKQVPLKRRSALFEKDEIHVGKEGRAQLRMIDQALISLQENSVLQIKSYQFKKGGRNNSALLELLSGGLRTITGAIGKGNKKAYELRTPLATIGIRGTDYEVEIVSNGMFVAVWDGVIQLRSLIKNGCNMLIGRSQPYMFVFIDRLGKCKGLQKVPDVFATGHSSNIQLATNRQRPFLFGGKKLSGRGLVIEPLIQAAPEKAIPGADISTGNPETPDPVTPDVGDPVTDNPDPDVPIVDTAKFQAFTIDQGRPSTELSATSSSMGSTTPTFQVGLNQLDISAAGTLSNFEQSVGGYPVSWGYWNDFNSTLTSKNINGSGSPDLNGLIWSAYNATDPAVVTARTGSFHQYGRVSDSLLSGSAGLVTNLQIQMDVNFETGNVTNGALSANTPADTWVAVFDGKIQSGDLELQLNGASVVDSNPSTPSDPRDASGFIAGDFVGNQAQAIHGAFGLAEDGAVNHIEGVFIVEEGAAPAQ